MTIYPPRGVKFGVGGRGNRQFLHRRAWIRFTEKSAYFVNLLMNQLKNYVKLHKKNRISKAYAREILKKIKSLIKILKLKCCDKVFLASVYKEMTISYFLQAGIVAAFLPANLTALHFLWMLVFPGVTLPQESSGTGNDEKNKRNKVINSQNKNKHRKNSSTIRYLKLLFPEIEDIIETGLDGPPIAIYIRVSTLLQVTEGKSLEYQREELLNLAKEKIKASLIYIISDRGKSGRNFSNRNLGIILRLAEAGKIQRLLVSEVDRAGRDAFELLFYLFQLRQYNVVLQTPHELLDLKRLVDLVNLAFKSASAEDQVLARGAGSKRTKVGNFLKGQWNIPIPLGYKKTSKRSWIKKDTAWNFSRIFYDIFVLYNEMKNYQAVCRTVNLQYTDFLMSALGRQLTSKEISRILKNSVYFGQPHYGEEIRKDQNLTYINDPEIFERAQKIIAETSRNYLRQEKRMVEIAKYCDPEALKCIENVIVPCPKCGRPMDGNGHPGYKCIDCDKNRTDLKKYEVACLRKYVLNRERILAIIIRDSKKYKLSPKAEKEVAQLERLLEKAVVKASKEKAKRAKKEVKNIEPNT